MAVALKTADISSTFKDTIIEQQKTAMKVSDRSKPSEPVVDGIDTGRIAKLTCMGFESSVNKVPNIFQSSELSECDPSRRNPILTIADRIKPYCGWNSVNRTGTFNPTNADVLGSEPFCLVTQRLDTSKICE